jgi:hypothetical protein
VISSLITPNLNPHVPTPAADGFISDEAHAFAVNFAITVSSPAIPKTASNRRRV